MTNVDAYIEEILNGGTSGAKTLVQAFNDGEIKVGDYVNYTPETHDPITVGTSDTGYTNDYGMTDGTDQTFSQDASTTWRVLGLSEDGEHLLLTSGSPIKKDGDDPYLILESYIGADNCVTVLNNISSLYNNSTLADETRSITIDDIANALGGVTVNYEYGTVTLNGSDTVIGETTGYESYTYEYGDYTLTNPPQDATPGTTVNGDAYWIYYTENDEVTPASYIDETLYNMLFADTTESTTGGADYSKSYWLASPGVKEDKAMEER